MAATRIFLSFFFAYSYFQEDSSASLGLNRAVAGGGRLLLRGTSPYYFSALTFIHGFLCTCVRPFLHMLLDGSGRQSIRAALYLLAA